MKRTFLKLSLANIDTRVECHCEKKSGIPNKYQLAFGSSVETGIQEYVEKLIVNIPQI